MVALATAATIIASQAVITGAFSLTQQAIQLGLLPRLEIRRTSETEKGQIYIPRVNWLLLVAVLYLVIVFRSSSALAAAYGIAVTGTMVITTAMAFFVLWKCWRWRPATAALVIAPFLAIDLVFLMANVLKIVEGGWMPLAVGAALMVGDADLAPRHAHPRREGAQGRGAASPSSSRCWRRARPSGSRASRCS